ncbi:MAG: TetR/AcrR family transcriptional regulator [Cellvibrionales bacterium]|nr:TetR/AcrR family transcriptional regulator [Cellvibrionales bacterium]
MSESKLSREDIIASVAELIAEQGLENLTMRNIANHVGCSVGTLPHYFDGKDDIVVAALNWSNERIFSRLGNMPLSDIRIDSLLPLIASAMPIDEHADIEWRVRLCLWDYAVTSSDMRETVNTINQTVIELIEGLIEQLQKNNEVQPELNTKITALTFYQLCMGGGFNMLHSPLAEREEKLQPLLHYIQSLKL